MRRLIPAALLAALLIAIAPALAADVPTDTSTSTGDQTQAQIDATQSQIDQLKQEIAQLQTQLNQTTAQKQTLQSAIKALNLNIQKLQTSIALTTAQIKQKDSEIRRLSGNITTTQGQIGDTQTQVASSLRQLNQVDEEPLATALLAGKTLSSFFDQAIELESLRSQLENRIENLGTLKDNLQTSKDTAQSKRNDLASLQRQLNQQKQGLTIAKDSQTQLLAQTQNKESSYQALIAQKQAQEAKFEQDLLTFQQKLGLTTDSSTLPPTGSAPLAWPLASVRITQYFGNTPFATQNPQIYSGHGHTGVDLAASPGTPVLAARDGIVLGTGNTDATCPYASFGKWVFIEHDDGLSTLYAHLGSFTVLKGDTVTTGQVVGYSDTTGYATGPHLHFGVYASSGSEIASFPSSSCKGKTYTMPVGDLSAYLNPLSYLPSF
ncbi:MAG: peptidoglycan DD-metalloendopeptidase family protein [Patescibacteria group bacterium]|nr:peptidoglycan DD-metalloendopeptidase family protein [Patescibacteria group bacterium]